MKVLFFSHQAEFIYGGEVVTLAMMRALMEQGVEVHFASPRGPYADRAKAFVRCHETPSVEFSRKLGSLPAFLTAYRATRKKLEEIITSEGFELVHAQSLKAAVYTRGLSLPVIWHHHDILRASFTNDMWLRWLARGVEGVLTPSVATKQALIESGINGSTISVIENGFPLDEWKVRAPRTSGDSFLLIMIGEISFRKGGDRMIELVRELRKANQEIQLKIVGEGLSNPAFSKRIKEQAIDFPEVEFLGRRNDIPHLLQQADALFVPSRQDPLPTVIVEAMLSGVPVLASAVGGIPEMIESGETGFLCATTSAFAENILKLKNDPVLWEKIATRARQVAEQRYSVFQVAERLVQYYGSVLFSR